MDFLLYSPPVVVVVAVEVVSSSNMVNYYKNFLHFY